jgi:hypothetical protein
MTALTVQSPTEVGGNLTYSTMADGVGVFPAASGQRYVVLFRNTGGSASVPTFDDPNSASPVGATAFNPDLVGASIPATTGATFQMISGSRFRDTSGNVNFTLTNAAATLFCAVLGPF